MTVDEQLRAAVRDAASGHGLDEEHALRAVRAQVRVDPVDVEERLPRPARRPRLVAVLAACGIVAGAVALPFALRSPRDHPAVPAAASGRCGQELTSGYRSTAVVRMAQEAPGTTGPRLRTDPVQTALDLCDKVVAGVHPRTDEIRFEADRNARGDLLSLIVSTPNAEDTAGLARAWANALVAAVRADARRQIIEQQNQLSDRVRRLHEELRGVDTELAQEMPDVYKDVSRVDAPSGGPHDTLPPVPEQGSVRGLNLAFERISILEQLTKSATESSQLRINKVKPALYASAVSVSAPARFPESSGGSGPSAAAVATGLLVGAALLAVGSVWLVRRRRAESSSP